MNYVSQLLLDWKSGVDRSNVYSSSTGLRKLRDIAGYIMFTCSVVCIRIIFVLCSYFFVKCFELTCDGGTNRVITKFY